MSEFLKNLRDVKIELWKLHFFVLGLNTIIVFLLSLILLKFLRLFWIFAIFPTIFYLVSRFLHRRFLDKATIKEVSEKHPELDEKVKTAYDNKDKCNIVVNDLLQDISKDFHEMESSSFLNMRKISWKIFSIIILVFVFLSINVINFDAYFAKFNPWNILSGISPDNNNFLSIITTPQGSSSLDEWEISNYTTKEEQERLGGEGGGKIPGFSKGPIPGEGGGAGTLADEDIFGMPSSAKISGEEIKMQIHPEYGGEIDIKEESTKDYSQEISISQAKGAEIPSQEPLEYEEIIKRYFEKLLEEEK